MSKRTAPQKSGKKTAKKSLGKTIDNAANLDKTRELAQVGVQLAQAGELDQGLKLLEKAVARAPKNASLCFNYGTTLLMARQIAPAIKELRKAARGEKIYLEEIQKLGNQHYRGERLPEALACFQAVAAVAPNNPQIQHCLALIYLHAGENELAQQTLREMRNAAPQNSAALLLLAENNWLTADDQRAAKTLSAENDWQLQYTRGWLAEKDGDYATAFKHFARANEICDRERPVNARVMSEQLASHVNLLGRNFTREFFTRFNSTETAAPIFIVGMPRSGCRLLSKLLAVDTTLGETGALEWFNQKMYTQISQNQNNFAAMLSTLNAACLREWTTEFLRESASVAPEKSRFIANNPTNFLNLWLIALMFPRAKIIHCRREVRAAALSAYQYNLPLAFTADLSSYGRYYGGYQRIMDFWKSCLPLPIYEVNYEDLVKSPEATLTAVRRFGDLPAINATSLSWAKRRLSYVAPLATEAAQISLMEIDKWRNYEQYLSSLFAGLESVAPAMSASPLYNFLEHTKTATNKFAADLNEDLREFKVDF